MGFFAHATTCNVLDLRGSHVVEGTCYVFLLVSIRFIPKSFLYFFQQPPRKHEDQSALQVSFDDKYKSQI